MTIHDVSLSSADSTNVVSSGRAISSGQPSGRVAAAVDASSVDESSPEDDPPSDDSPSADCVVG